jgi:hypothetical protein
MRVATLGWRPRSAAAAVLSVGLIVAVPGCTLDKDEPSVIGGPSETVVSVQLVALPDTVNADGVTRSVVRLTLRDQNGQPATGRAVLFELLTGDGTMMPSAASTFVGPVQTGLVMATADDGTANVIYVAGFAFTTATIGVRAYNFDAARDYLSTVEIIQR